MSKKQVNYTEAQTQQIVEAYQAETTDEGRKACVEKLAQEFGKTPSSVRMKLVREGAYIKPEYVSKAGTKAETKAAIVESIATIFGVNSEQLQGLDKATKSALNTIRSKYLEAVKPTE